MGGINMTNEQLEKGKALSNRIGYLEEQLGKWKRAINISNDAITILDENRTMIGVSSTFVNFEVMKALAISLIESELNERKTEFANL